MTREGVIKYQLEYECSAPFDWPGYSQLEAWRKVCFRLGMIGRDDRRYGGLAYGNISQRIQGSSFVISGTQTGGAAHLQRNGYCLVKQADLKRQAIIAKGPCRPSSEALTHGAVYHSSEIINVVIHGHCTEIWEAADCLDLPQTRVDVAYGTAEMAAEVIRLVGHHPSSGIMVMKGHRDGVLAYGIDCRQAGGLLVNTLAEAFAVANPGANGQQGFQVED